MPLEQQFYTVASQGEDIRDLQSAAMEAAGNAIVITDRVGMIRWVNTAFEQLTGYSAQEVIGQSTRLLKSGVHPDSFYKNLWDTVLAGNQWRGELTNRRKDGTFYAEEMTINPVRNPGRESTHFVAVKLDITQRKRLEEETQRSETRFHTLFDSTSDAVMLLDEKGFFDCNKATLVIYGCPTREEFCSRHPADFSPPTQPCGTDSLTLANKHIATAIEKGSNHFEWVHKRANTGENFPADVLLTAMELDSKPVVQAVVRDITERKRAEEELYQSRQMLRSVLDAIPERVFWKDLNSSYLGCNTIFASDAGLNDPAEIIGKNDHELAWRESSERFRADDKLVMEQKTPRLNFEEPQDRPDGSQRWLRANKLPLRDRKSKVIGLIGTYEDITESKRVEAALRQSEEQFRQLADNIQEVFFVVTPEPVRMAYLSPAYEEIWGRSRQEAYERPAAWIESVHSEDREGFGGFYARSLQGVQSKLAYRIVRPDGSIRWIDARSFPVRDSTGKLIRIVGIAEDTTARRERMNALKEAHEKLNVALEVSKEQTQDAAKLAELVDILQSCQDAEEAFKIAGNVLQGMLRSTSGALYITSPSRDVVEMVTSWGNVQGTEKVFRPNDCWALRRGRVHRVKDSESPLRCEHVSKLFSNGYICVPLAAQGETLGVLYVEDFSEQAGAAVGPRRDQAEILERQATAVGERISLALANLRLREVLRSQSIRDPLTGLFNRRFMEESLERELRRALRGEQQVAVVMLDIDHFKQFNDTFGHQAGDALLRAFGNLLNESTRGQDVACRYGGEEFTLVLSGSSVDAARKRAELLRENMKQLNVRYGGQLLGAVTLSIGIAVFPENGDSAEHLLKAADDALYRAKEEGRDRIISA